jgi:AcrR family transcriptional regulator
MARPSNSETKKTELLAKAKTCFTRFGFSKTTLEDIAKEANMNKATLYHYFDNKEALFLEVMLQVATEGLQQLMQQTTAIKSPEKQLLSFFSARTDFYLQLIRLNGLTKESVLQLQANFDRIYSPEKEKEIAFVAGIVKSLVPTLNAKQLQTQTRLLFSIADALKHEGVLLGNLLENNANTTEKMRQQITAALQLIINGLLK